MSSNGRLSITKIWRGSYVKYVKQALQKTMRSLSTQSLLIYVLVLVMVFCEAVMSEDSCYCDSGCYRHGFQTICCDEICRDADARQVGADCRQKCPSYEGIIKMKKKMEESNDVKDNKIQYWKDNFDEQVLKLKMRTANLNSSLVELRRLKAKLRDFESSGKLMSGLATPLFLFGALIIILVVCVCLYQNSEVCKRKANVHEDIEGSNEDYGGYGRSKFNGSHIDPTSESSFLGMKTSVLDSGLPQHRSDKPPEYFSGGKVGRVPSRHSQDDTGVVMPCVGCAPTPPSSLEQYARANNHFHQNFPVTLQQQLPQRQQLQSQQLHHTFPLQQLQFLANNQTQSNNVTLANQLEAHQVVHRELAESGSDRDQARRSAKNARTHNEAEFRLAHLDFNHEPQQSSKQPQLQLQRVKNNNLASANTNNPYVGTHPVTFEANPASPCT